MIEPNILAFQNAELLDVIATGEHNTTNGVADKLGRDPSNLRKSLKALIAEGLIFDDFFADGLTPDGQAQLAAFKRAKHGGERRRAKGRWPLDKFRRNLGNRSIDPESVLGLADAIVGVGDVLMPLVASMPDANGVRTIWAGERRWMAATRLVQLGELPEALIEGLPFVEREADAGEAAIIAVVENTARADLTPWEDAQLLLTAARALGLDKPGGATELARRIGRARDGDRGGVRDVQTKLKVAREATPEAIAAYAQDGSWDRLRNSVSEPTISRPSPSEELSASLAASGPAVLAQPQAAIEHDSKPGADNSSDPLPELAAASGPAALDDPDWALNPPWVAEPPERLTHGRDRVEVRLFHHPDRDHWFVSLSTQIGDGGIGENYRVRDDQRACGSSVAALKAARARMLTRHPATPKGLLAAFDDLIDQHTTKGIDQPRPADLRGQQPSKPTDPLIVNGHRYPNATRAAEARRLDGIDPNPSNTGGGRSTAPTTAVPATLPESAITARTHPLATAPAQLHPTNEALRLIAIERAEQVEKHGWTPGHDDLQNSDWELPFAAAAYALAAAEDSDAANFWPAHWDAQAFRPRGGMSDLVKAGALIVAEIERINRELSR